MRAVFQVVTRTIYQETGHAIGAMNCYSMVQEEMEREFGREGEDLLVLGALKVLGLHGSFDPAVDFEKDMEFPLQVIGDLKKRCIEVPWIFTRDYQHTGMHPGVTMADADRVVAVMQRAVERLEGAPELLERYQREMRDLVEHPPWAGGGAWSV